MHLYRSFLFLILLSSVGWVGSLQAQSVLLNYFNVQASGSDILVEWEVKDEASITEYRLFRKFDNDPSFAFVSTISATGLGKYQYLDDKIFKNTGRVVHYELQVITSSKVHKFNTSLSHNPTSIQRTWGSIKSMFRG